ncbi:hypothetical protein [Streptomyces sp. NPDC051364]|uniref:hypothetical protein n=1 Tax=Streptomyces sp. NPDC051364 TaxID=3155799 RepID=UPI003447C174
MARLDQRGWNGSRAVPVFLAFCVVLTAACTSSGDSDSEKGKPATPTVSAVPSKSASLDPAEVVKTEALTAYKAYWAELPKAFAIPAIEGTDLKRYAAFEALTKAQQGTANLKANGRVMTGQPVVSNSTVTAAELEKTTPNVTISSCLDVSNWKIVDKKSGAPAPAATSSVTKYVVTGHMERWDGSWKVLKEDLHADQPC